MRHGDPQPPAHRHAPHGTSEVAARMIRHRAPGQRARVLAAIRAAGSEGLTDDEGERQTGLKPQSYTPRRNELAKAGLIRDTGTRRPTESGRPAAVWVTTDDGEQAG
ncbi:MAG: hypothetical protein AAFR96_06465 [Planctomycetota bacterium]